MNIIKRIKNWFSPPQPKEEYYIDFRKLRQQELEMDFNMINNYVDLRYVFERIPYRWELHIDKCVQYDEIEIATSHLLYWSKMCQFALMTYGINCDLTPLWKKIKNSKRYKELMIEEKLERMKADFE